MTWIIAAAATACVIIRPFRLPEAIWAVGGALLLVSLQLLSPRDAWQGVIKGTDVYLFLVGMMLLSEVARENGLFDWLAAQAARAARGSPTRLFLLVYGVGTIVTIFLSNDATAVVLTPAVAAAARAAKAEEPLPYLLICATIANAASFVLPISNPANLVIYGDHMPPLLQWLPRYALPSVVSIVVTYGALRWSQRKALRQTITKAVPVPDLSNGGRTAACGLFGTAMVLLACSALDVELGLPTALAGLGTAAVTLVRESRTPWRVMKGISWGVLPLVAGLFVLVEALDRTGVIRLLASVVQSFAQQSARDAAWATGIVLALASNAMNNLPAGLIAGSAVRMSAIPDAVRSAVLIGVDLGPNLSVTGSLATILWLNALRREGQHVSAWSFLKVGVIVMPPALLLTLGTALFFS